MAMRRTPLIAALLALAVASLLAVSPSAAQAAAAAAPAPMSEEQLEQLVAPIALYPDALLGQILMAATYPLEVVEAARWVEVPGNAALHGDALAAALEAEDWDPSVKSLVPFPQILQLMNARLDWLQKLGDAFLAQQSDVMAAVQRLRERADAAGALITTPQQEVIAEGPTIIIAPANPAFVYPPCYNAALVYGPWPYPAYPPYVLPLLPTCVYGPTLFFGVGVAVIPALWGWGHCDWTHHRIRIDADRFNALNRRAIERFHRPKITQDTWQHDPYHRRSVPYRDPATRARFAPPAASGAAARRAFRFYPGTAPSGETTHTPAGRPGAPPAATPPSVEQGAPPAFAGIRTAPAVRSEAQRGYQSLHNMTLPVGRGPAPGAARGGGGAPSPAPGGHAPAGIGGHYGH
jgi:hypothetical protein